MRRLLIAAVAAFALGGAAAAITPQQQAILFSKPSWLLPGAALACDFANGRYYNCSVGGNFTFTRATTGYAQWRSGLWTQFASGAPRITDKGWLFESTMTNNALWSRDLTQAGTWAKVNMTAALNATGIDGVASSATTLTATGASASILQTTVLGLTSETYSVFLKGVTVTGAVNITINNLVGTTACTVATGDTQFTRCSVNSTLANPIIGIQIVNSGDVVIADMNQLEAVQGLTTPTSPTPATNAAVTRNVDVAQLAGTSLAIVQAASGAVVIHAPTGFPLQTVNASRILASQGGAANAAIFAVTINSTTVLRSVDANNGNALSATLGSGATSTALKAGLSWSSAGRSLVGNAGTVGTNANVLNPASVITGVSVAGPTSPISPNGYLGRIDMFDFKPPDATLQSFTANP